MAHNSSLTMSQSTRNPCPCGSGKPSDQCCGAPQPVTPLPPFDSPSSVTLLLQQTEQHLRNGQLQEAASLCHQILQQCPGQPDALHLLGVIAHRSGHYAKAKELIAQAIEQSPRVADYYCNLALALTALQEPSEAIGAYRQALTVKPDYAEAHFNLGILYRNQGTPDQAIECYQCAIRLKPDFAAAHAALGGILKAEGDLEAAIRQLERALTIQPAYAKAQFDLGAAQLARGNLIAAVACFEDLLGREPDSVPALICLGTALLGLDRLGPAATCFEKAVTLAPDLPNAHASLGQLYDRQGDTAAALARFRKALQLDPDYVQAYVDLGKALAGQGQIAAALDSYRRALQLQPDCMNAHAGYLLTLNYSSSHSAEEIFRAHVAFARRFADPLSEFIQAFQNTREPDRRLRIGYVSPDFCAHSVAYFVAPVFAHHDKGRFELFAYYNHHFDDAVTKRLRGYCDHWRTILGCPDATVAAMIRQDQIDILIDLAGHTAHSRLLVFARKPAPVQVSWIGYPNTTGLSAMDYRISDRFADPPELTDRFHTEQLVRLPECFSCFQAPEQAPEVAELPALKNSYVTFGCFNNPAKISPPVIALWAQLLQAVPGARLCLKSPRLGSPALQQSVRKAFDDLGIPSRRLSLFGSSPSQQEHLAHYNRVDIALDSFPYNGTTTNCDALWMGVPVVTLAGNTHAARVGVSQMTNLGLPELIAADTAEYLAIAKHLAADLARLQGLRTGLRQRMSASPLMNAARFTGHLEAAYRRFWQQWCDQA